MEREELFDPDATPTPVGLLLPRRTKRWWNGLVAFVLPVAWACADPTQVVVPDGGHPAEIAGPRSTSIANLDGSPGECYFNIPVTPDGTGLLGETSTGCILPDSMLATIQVKGRLTSSNNPAAFYCAGSHASPAVGIYGPMGGGGTHDWLKPMITVRGTAQNTGTTFNLGPRHPTTNAAMAFGATDETVAYNNGGNNYLNGRGGTLIKVLRSELLATVGCSTHPSTPPGCEQGNSRACGPVSIYHVNGEQVLTVKPIAATLQLASSPAPSYQGDTVTFTASSSDSRPVSVRQWIWQDSTGAESSPGCSIAAAVCKFRPAGSGRMTVRARVGTNAFIEQASKEALVLPLLLIATPTPYAVAGSLDDVTVQVRTVPHRELSAVGITITPYLMALRSGSFSSSGSAMCDPGSGECELSGGTAPSTLTVTATTVQGVTLTTTVEVEQLPCPTGNSVLDSKEMRALLDSLWKLGGNQDSNKSARRERGAMLVDSAGVLVVRYIPLDTNTTPCTTTWPTSNLMQFIPPQWLPGTMTIVSVLHTHPWVRNDTFPPNCPAPFPGGTAGKGPSHEDWNNIRNDKHVLNTNFKNDTGVDLFAPNYQPIVVDPDHLWLIDPKSSIPWVQVPGSTPPKYMVDTVVVGNNLQGWQRAKPLTSNSCSSPVSLPPTFVK